VNCGHEGGGRGRKKAAEMTLGGIVCPVVAFFWGFDQVCCFFDYSREQP